MTTEIYLIKTKSDVFKYPRLKKYVDNNIKNFDKLPDDLFNMERRRWVGKEFDKFTDEEKKIRKNLLIAFYTYYRQLGGKEYIKCEECDKKYKFKSSLIKHKQIKHKH